jgi:hypothetical protein
MDDDLSFADYVDDLHRTAQELREDVTATCAVTARLLAEAQAIRDDARRQRRPLDEPSKASARPRVDQT